MRSFVCGLSEPWVTRALRKAHASAAAHAFQPVRHSWQSTDADGSVEKMRGMALDLGTRTIGLAVTDELGVTAQGLPTLERRGLRRDLEALTEKVADYAVDRFILGLPLNMDGSEGPRAEATRRFGHALEEKTSLPVIYQDERLTTVAATRVLLEGDVSRQKRKAVIDQLAAVLILQSWLAAQPSLSHETDETP